MQVTLEDLDAILHARPTTVIGAPEHAELEDVEAAVDELAGMSTRDLMDRAMSEPAWNPLMVALVDRLRWYAEEIGHMEDELRAAGRLPRKQPGKVIHLRTRLTHHLYTGR